MSVKIKDTWVEVRKKFWVKGFIKVSRGEAMKVLRCCIMLFNKAQWGLQGAEGEDGIKMECFKC